MSLNGVDWGTHNAVISKLETAYAEITALRGVVSSLNQRVKEEADSADTQQGLKDAALEELKRLDPNNKLLNPEYRKQLAAQLRKEREAHASAAEAAEKRRSNQAADGFRCSAKSKKRAPQRPFLILLAPLLLPGRRRPYCPHRRHRSALVASAALVRDSPLSSPN